MDKNSEELSLQPFAEALLSDEVKDVGIDIAEMLLDSFNDETSVLKEIPVLRTFIAIRKTAKNIQDLFAWKSQLVFLAQVKQGKTDANSLMKRKKAFDNKEKWFFKEVETLNVYLAKYTALEKAKLQAEFYLDFINNVITWEKFNECLDILLQLFLSDLPHLLEIHQNELRVGLTKADLSDFDKKVTTKFDETSCRRLMAVGLLYQLHPMSFAFSLDNYFITSDMGRYFCEVVRRCAGE